MSSITFVNPAYGPGHYSRASRSPAVTKSATVYYPIWLAYAAGCAEAQGHEVSIVDAAAKRLPHSEAVRRLAANPPDIAVVDTTTPSIASDLRLVALIRDALPSVRILAVGTHVSALPEEALDAEPALDAVALGEYDLTVADFAGSGDASLVKGLVWRDGGAVRVNEPREAMHDLDSLPFVSRVYRDHLDIRDYFWSTGLYPMVMVVTGRGCPQRCAWCLYPQTMHGRRYRMRSAENVVDELAFISREMPSVREVGFEDDTFTASRRHAREVCETILSRRLKMRWWANVRADLDKETMDLMRRAGCRLLVVGFESGSQDVLDRMHKGIRLDDAERFMANARSLGMPVRACFVVGQMGETRESMQATLRRAIELDPDTAQFFPMIVYPGTEAYDWACSSGALTTRDFSKWLTERGTHSSLVRTGELSPDEVTAFVDKATRDFYLRPRVVLRTAWRMLSSPHEARRIVRAMRRFGRFLFK